MSIKRLSAIPSRPARLAAAILCLGLYASPPSVAQSEFTRLPGTARSIGVGANGALWAIGTGQVGSSGDYNIFRWTGTAWARTSGSGVKLAVDPAGNALVINAAGQVYRYAFSGTPEWTQFPPVAAGAANGSPRTASEVAAGANGAIWIIGSSTQPAVDHPIYRWTNQAWEPAPGAAAKIAVASNGAAWVINSQNELYERDLNKRTWIEHPVTLRSIAIGSNGAKFGVGTEATAAGNYKILQQAGDAWIPRDAAGVSVAVGPAGEPYVLNAAGEIYRGTPLPASLGLISSTITETSPEPGSSPIVISGGQPPGWNREMVPFNGGKMVCSGVACGNTKADWAGPYKLDVSCDEGTYQTIYGGTCWTCPRDDREVGTDWTLVGHRLGDDNASACSRTVFNPATDRATWVKFGWSWDCNYSQGEFWDTHDANGKFVWGGSCWKCANPEYPERTIRPIAGPDACKAPAIEFASPTLLRFNGCPEPDAQAMGLRGQRTPDKPFLDIAGGWSAGVASGGCYACPTVDENGDILLTSRNAFALNGRGDNDGCTVNFRWTPPVFPEPGFSGLDGAKEFLAESNLLARPSDLTVYLRVLAEARRLTGAQADQFVRTEWQRIAQTPYQSELRSIVYGRLATAAQKKPEQRTAAERKLLASFENYVRIRRTFVARQALAMYDAWKSWSDTNQGANSRLTSLFSYGRVPLDFHKTLSTGIALGGVGGGVAVSVERINTWRSIQRSAGDNAQTISRSVGQNVRRLNILRPGFGMVLTGTNAALMAYGVLLSIALDQFIEIKTARPKLLAAVAGADVPVDLAAELNRPDGEDVVLNYWGKAMEISAEREDPQVVTAAQAAYAMALAKNFQP